MKCDCCTAILLAKLTTERPPEKVWVEPTSVLTTKSYFCRMALATSNLNMSRRAFADDLALVLYNYSGEIRLRTTGERVWLHDQAVDNAFGDDGSFRWLSAFMACAAEPPKRRPQDRIAARLDLIDLYFKIKHPSIARHFGR